MRSWKQISNDKYNIPQSEKLNVLIANRIIANDIIINGSGELIQTKIYNQNNSGTGILSISGGGTNVTWKSLTFTLINNPNDSIVVIEVYAPYAVNGSLNDLIYAMIDDTTSISVTQSIVKTSQKWNQTTGSGTNGGGGTRSGTILPLIGSYTPSQATSTKTRTIRINFQNLTDDDLLEICKIYTGNSFPATDQNTYTIKISEYNK